MRRLSFDKQFANEAGNDLLPGKIHTIRCNFDFWKKNEGQEVELYYWEGKPRQQGSKQKVFSTKRIVSVQGIYWGSLCFWEDRGNNPQMGFSRMSKNDGFEDVNDFIRWFRKGNYKPGKMAILHFTDFRY
jgi:hypothetical protein